jgi:hypothetical protein
MNYPALYVVTTVFLLILIANYQQDRIDSEYVSSCKSHKEVPVAPLPENTKLQVESIVADYIERDRRNTSNTASVTQSAVLGILSGIGIGILTNTPLESAIPAAVVAGVVAGTLEGNKLLYMKPKLLHPDKT